MREFKLNHRFKTGNMKHKFKVGDRVRRTEESFSPEKYGFMGQVYTISSVLEFNHKDLVGLVEIPIVGRASAEKFELVERNHLPEELFEL